VSTAEPPDATSEHPPPVDPEPAPAPTPAVRPEHRPELFEEDRPSTWQPLLYTKIVVLLVVVAYAIAFVVKNTRQIKIDFVFSDANVRVIWTILLLLAIGLVSGVLLSQLYRHRRRAQHARKARDA
jgi:uncharacterized integral membrane protein